VGLPEVLLVAAAANLLGDAGRSSAARLPADMLAVFSWICCMAAINMSYFP